MSFLTFVIPTRKRHRELAACLRSIAEQVGEHDVNIVVLYNNPEEQTIRAIERAKAKWPFISARGFDGEPDYADKFLEMFRASPDSEWVWTFGDDEVLSINALSFVIGRLKAAPPELAFLHISERKRSTGSGNTYTGRMVDLCCQFGWLEFTGFISGNITRGPLLAKCAETENWPAYARTAYVQSCALFEGLRKEQAQLIDLPLYDTQPDVDPEVNAIKQQQWIDANTETRYLFLADAVQVMYDKGLIKSKLPARFFRYHNAHLWDRHILCFVSIWLGEKKVWCDDWALYVKRMAGFVAEKEIAEKIVNDVNVAGRLVLTHSALHENCKMLEADLCVIMKERSVQLYPLDMVESEKESNGNISYMWKAA